MVTIGWHALRECCTGKLGQSFVHPRHPGQAEHLIHCCCTKGLEPSGSLKLAIAFFGSICLDESCLGQTQDQRLAFDQVLPHPQAWPHLVKAQ